VIEGAAISIISEETYETLFSQVPLNQESVGLHTYNGESISICGQISVDFQCSIQKRNFP